MAECSTQCAVQSSGGCNADLRSARVIFLVGGPGSGKGTQSELIVKKFKYIHLSTGDMLRAEVSSGTPRAAKLKAMMDKGELVPMETVLDLVKEAMQKCAGSGKPYLIDGYPRELQQAKSFESSIAPVESVLYFETMKERIMKRGETSGRSDDNEATIVRRIETFHQTNQPLVDYYFKQNKLYRIDAEGDVKEIFAEVCEVLEPKSKGR